MAEKFQPRTRASFTKHQLELVNEWITDQVHTTPENFLKAFERALLDAETDEKGRPMSEKGRERLRLGMLVKANLSKDSRSQGIFGEAIVWQMSSDPTHLQVRFLHLNSGTPRFRIS